MQTKYLGLLLGSFIAIGIILMAEGSVKQGVGAVLSIGTVGFIYGALVEKHTEN